MRVFINRETAVRAVMDVRERKRARSGKTRVRGTDMRQGPLLWPGSCRFPLPILTVTAPHCAQALPELILCAILSFLPPPPPLRPRRARPR